jgi:2-oxoisovalerate dehydrogenase E2 component (dihydrolipoyl transacylase)
MSQYVFKMPDLGEGTVEAEIVAWHTAPGAVVTEDEILVEVMTDKAAVEVPAPVSGRIISIAGAPGDKIAVGAPLIVFEVGAAPARAAGGAAELPAATPPVAAPAPASRPPAAPVPPAPVPAVPAAAAAQRPTDAEKQSGVAPATRAPEAVGAIPSGAARIMTSPANRRRAREAGIDLATVVGSGPGGRIVRGDLPAAGGAPGGDLAPRAAAQSETLPRGGAAAGGTAATGIAATGIAAAGMAATGIAAAGMAAAAAAVAATAGARIAAAGAETTEIKVIGVRRLIAERMSEAKRTIPHFAYVEEVDVTELDALRRHLNSKLPEGVPPYTYLPLVVLALVRTLESFPQCNVLYDAARGVLVRHRAVHVGVATQTDDGLKVPVVRNAQALGLPQLAAQIRAVTERARANKASRDELVGSTITVTSLGKLGGIASTPIINAPEVAIIGLNKAVERPVVQHGAVAVRRIMNLSSSFDHRFVDGYDAAAMIQTLKELLEHPAMIFIPKVNVP